MKSMFVLTFLVIVVFGTWVGQESLARLASGGRKLPEPISAYSEPTRELIRKAFEGFDTTPLCDYHMHALGTGEKGSGNYVNHKMLSWRYPGHHMRFKIYAAASGITDTEKAESQFLEYLFNQINHIPGKGKYCLFAFDQYHNTEGIPIQDKSEFYIGNEYVFQLAEQYPDRIIPVMSVHPYRKDAVDVLRKYAARGGRVVKWLPNAMGIDPSHPRCDSFYATMKELNLVLLSHGGEEQAVEAEEEQHLGNPMLLRRPLDMGIKVIVAHCASLGSEKIMDARGVKHERTNIDLFFDLLREKKYEGLLFGDISAITQFNRCDPHLQMLIDSTQYHHRLVNGSDYPLPAVDVVIRTRKLMKLGFITKEERKCLNEIYETNPLLFDFVLKRCVRSPKTGNRFDMQIFGIHRDLYP